MCNDLQEDFVDLQNKIYRLYNIWQIECALKSEEPNKAPTEQISIGELRSNATSVTQLLRLLLKKVTGSRRPTVTTSNRMEIEDTIQ